MHRKVSKLASINPRVLYALLLVMISIPFFHPLGIPIVVHPAVRDFFTYVEKFPAGSVIVYEPDLDVAGSWGEIRALCIAVLNHLLTKDIKIVIVTFSPDGLVLTSFILQNVNQDLLAKKKYGQDFVNLGFVPGLENGMAAFVNDVHRTVLKDTQGTSIEEIPMMQNIHSAKDITAVVQAAARFDFIEMTVRQWGAASSVPILMMTSGSNQVGMFPFVPRYVKAYAVSIPAAAEYEKLIGRPAEGTTWIDAFGMAFALAFICVIAANIGSFAMRSEKKREEEERKKR